MGSTNPTASERVDADQLRRFTHQTFEQCGMSVTDAELLADHLVWADLQGMSSLGLTNIPSYVAALRAGTAAVATRELKVAFRRGGFMVVDAEDALGPLVGHRVMREVIETARSTGVSAALVRNVIGPVVQGCAASLAVDEQMVGLAMNSSPPRRLSPGNDQEAGTSNAFAIASPAGQNPPLMLDVARSGIALARVDGHNQPEERFSERAGLTADGQPTFDPVAAFDEMLRPTDGRRRFGLAMLWKVLTAVLTASEASSIDQTSPTDASRPQGESMLLLAIDPTVSVPYEIFVASVDNLIDRIHRCRLASGGREQLTSRDERSTETMAQRPTNGVPLPGRLRTMLRSMAVELGISPSV